MGGVPGRGGKRMAMKARKRSELHIAESWLSVRLVYNCF